MEGNDKMADYFGFAKRARPIVERIRDKVAAGSGGKRVVVEERTEEMEAIRGGGACYGRFVPRNYVLEVVEAETSDVRFRLKFSWDEGARYWAGEGLGGMKEELDRVVEIGRDSVY